MSHGCRAGVEFARRSGNGAGRLKNQERIHHGEQFGGVESLARGESLRERMDGGDESDAAIDRIWRDYKKNASPALRNYLIIHYMGGHVRRIAQRLHAQLPPQVEIDDLVDEAYEGLVDVIERFDLKKDVRFETFSSKRLYGAMRDYLRRIDPVPRLARTRSKQAGAIVERFQKLHGRPPEAMELQHLLKHAAVARFRKVEGREPDDAERGRLVKAVDSSFRRMSMEGKPALTVSFGGIGGESRFGKSGGSAGEDQGDAMAGFEDHRKPSPLGRAELNDLRRWVTQGFTRRDRLIIVLYYYEQMTMKEIGATLGCSESRVSQRLESILQCLRSRMQRVGGEVEFQVK